MELLQFDASNRLTAPQALEHAALADFAWAEDEPVAMEPLLIEEEVDTLSPRSTKQAIIHEIHNEGGSCGSKPGQALPLVRVTPALTSLPDAMFRQSTAWRQWLLDDDTVQVKAKRNSQEHSEEEKDGVELSEKTLPAVVDDLEEQNKVNEWEHVNNRTNSQTLHTLVRSPRIEDIADLCRPQEQEEKKLNRVLEEEDEVEEDDVIEDDDQQTIDCDKHEGTKQAEDVEGKIKLEDTEKEKTTWLDIMEADDVITAPRNNWYAAALAGKALYSHSPVCFSDRQNRNNDIHNIYLRRQFR